MKNRKLILLITVLLILAFQGCREGKVLHNPPNIVFVFADDQRAGTVHALGNQEIITPNLDTLVAEGMTFTNTYIMGSYVGAVCQPSRAMLLTGKYLNNLTRNGSVIPETDTLLGQTLQKAGYNCYGIGKYHSDPASFARSFNDGRDIFFGGMNDHWNVPLNSYASLKNYKPRNRPVIYNWQNSNEVTYEQGEYTYGGKHSAEIFAEAAIGFIRNYDSEKPFFIYTALMTPHDPRSTYQKYFDRYDTAQLSTPPNFMPQHPFDNGAMRIRDEMLAPFPRTKPVVKEHIRDYYALITHNDDKLGEIITALKEKGVYENTLIIYSGDNGLALGQHGLFGKQNLYEHSTKVPLIISGKGVPAGQKTDAFVYLTDLFPTICDILNIPVPSSADGSSFYHLFKDPRSRHREYIVTTYSSFQRAIRDDRFKLIKYNVKGVRHVQLFDLEQDPYETSNLAGDINYEEDLLRLDENLDEQLLLLKDTLWTD